MYTVSLGKVNALSQTAAGSKRLFRNNSKLRTTNAEREDQRPLSASKLSFTPSQGCNPNLLVMSQNNSQLSKAVAVLKKKEAPQRKSYNASEVSYNTLRDQQKSNNVLKKKVDLLREQATINM